MRRWILGLALGAATSAGAGEPLPVSLLQEAVQTYPSTLRFDGEPGMYHLRYKVQQVEAYLVNASFGGVVREVTNDATYLGVEARVGDPSWDNTGFGGGADGFRALSVPDRADAYAIRLALWRLTDAAYRDAVEQLSRKNAQAFRPPDYPGDYTTAQGTTDLQDCGALGDGAGLRDMALRMSEEGGDFPRVVRSQVTIGYEVGCKTLVDTEGFAVRRPGGEVSIRSVVHVLTDDGETLTDQRLWSRQRPEQLPDWRVLRDGVVEMSRALSDLAEAPRLEEEYIGPVVFEQGAAVDLFRYVLLPQLLGTPAEVPFDTFLGDISAQRSVGRLGRRVLPPGFTVTDDPNAVPDHPGAFDVDAEGTPAQAVELVSDGIVSDLVSSRTPRTPDHQSNGHGDATVSTRAVGQTTFTMVTPAKRLSAKGIHRKAIQLAASYGRDHYMVVRSLQHASLRWLGSPDAWLAFEYTNLLQPPVAIVKVYRDGSEEILRSARFGTVVRTVLRDIVAAGPDVTRDVLSSSMGEDTYLGPVEGRVRRLTVPEVLVEELELIPSVPDRRKAPLVPVP